MAGEVVPDGESELARSGGAPVGRVLASGDESAPELPAALAVTALAGGWEGVVTGEAAERRQERVG